jgi:hypothetical protein
MNVVFNLSDIAWQMKEIIGLHVTVNVDKKLVINNLIQKKRHVITFMN